MLFPTRAELIDFSAVTTVIFYLYQHQMVFITITISYMVIIISKLIVRAKLCFSLKSQDIRAQSMDNSTGLNTDHVYKWSLIYVYIHSVCCILPSGIKPFPYMGSSFVIYNGSASGP